MPESLNTDAQACRMLARVMEISFQRLHDELSVRPGSFDKARYNALQAVSELRACADEIEERQREQVA